MNRVTSLIVSMAANWTGGVAKKYFTNRFGGPAVTRHIYNAVGSLVCAAVFLRWGGFGTASTFTLLLGVVFGIVTAVGSIASLKAIEIGPWAYTTVITSLSMLIPTLSGVLLWHEPIRVLQIFGMVLMVVCLILSVDTDADAEKRKASLRWLLFCAISFVCTGSIGVMQKWHQSSPFRGELNAFLTVAFVISFLYSAVSALILLCGKRKAAGAGEPGSSGRMPAASVAAGAEITTQQEAGKEDAASQREAEESEAPRREAEESAASRRGAAGNKAKWIALFLMVTGGVCAALNNKLNLYLSGVMPSMIFFPLVNGGGLILTTLSAFLLFRERLSLRQWIGLAAGFLAVLLLCF